MALHHHCLDSHSLDLLLLICFSSSVLNRKNANGRGTRVEVIRISTFLRFRLGDPI